MLVARTEPVFWILTEMGKRICFWWGRGTERANCCAIWGAGDSRMLRRKRGWAELALDLGVPREILTTTGRRTWRCARPAECGCFTTKAGERLLMERKKREFAARPAVVCRSLWVRTLPEIVV